MVPKMARGAQRHGRSVNLAGDGATVPQICACCGADAVRSSRVTRSRRAVFIPYCEACLSHASSGFTRDLATLLSSALLAFTLSFALPLWFDSVPLVIHVGVAVIASCVPVLLRFLVKPTRAPPHTATHLAAWWGSDGALHCTLPRFADALARANEVECQEALLREPGPRSWVWIGPLLALGLAPFGHQLNHPLIRVLNLTDGRINVLVDGKLLCSVEATSAESAAAGLEVRVPAGRRTLSATRADGAEIASAVVDVQPGGRHLYVPHSPEVCFWLEEAFYGRQSSAPKVVALTGAERFWRVPEHVDVWFSAAPLAEDDLRSSGGAVTALRQAPCIRAPRAVQDAVGLATPRE